MKYVQASDWKKFKEMFPEAHDWIHMANIRGEIYELTCCKEHFCPTEWERNRLAYLISRQKLLLNAPRGKRHDLR